MSKINLQLLKPQASSKMNRVLLIIMIVLGSNLIWSQVEMISFEDFKNNQFETKGISAAQKQALYPLYFNSPLIDEAEFRTQTNEFDLDQMQYTLRLSTNSKEVRKYQNRIYEDLKKEYLFELRQTQENQLEDLYKTYLEYYFDSQKLYLQKQILPIYDDIITLLSKEDKSGEVNVADLINASKQRDKLLIRLERDENKLSQQLELKGAEDQSIISVEELGKFLSFLAILSVPANLEEHQFELNKLENQYQLEKAERDRRWDFAQLRYRGNPDDIWEEKVSIGLGFRFPHSSKNSLDMIELQLEKMIEEEKFEQSKLEQQENLEQRQANMLEQFDNYNSAERIVQSLRKYDELTKSITPQSKSQIIDILRLNIDSIEEEINLIESKEDLYEAYIELAKAIGLMQDRISPMSLNLLSPDLLDKLK